MKRETSRRQRPLFHEGPVWQQLDESLQRQLIGRLVDICHLIVAPPVPLPADEPLTNQQEESDDHRD
jgi:hypothetical protein